MIYSITLFKNFKKEEKQEISRGFVLERLVLVFHSTIIHFFRTHHPNMEYSLCKTGSNLIMEMVKSGRADVGFVSFLPINIQTLKIEPIYREELFVVVSISHPLAEFDQIDLKFVKEEPFVAYKTGCGLRTLMDEFCKQAVFLSQIIFEGEEISSILECVSA